MANATDRNHIRIHMRSRVIKYAEGVDPATGVPFEILENSRALTTREVLSLMVDQPVTMDQIDQVIDKLEPDLDSEARVALNKEFVTVAEERNTLRR